MELDVKPLPGYAEPYGLLAAILQDGTNEWRWELDRNLGADAMVWQPFPGGHSIGGLFLHMINAEVFWFETFALGRAREADEQLLTMEAEIDVESVNWPVPPLKPLSWYLDLHDRVRIRTLEAMKDWPDPETAKPHHGESRTLRWAFGHVIQHESYHGGQAVLLQMLWKRRER